MKIIRKNIRSKTEKDIRAKKSLGQNFLKSKSAIEKIVSVGDLNNKSVVLEIGPGTGILTEALLGSGAKVVSIEKDRELIPLLQEKFAKELKSKQFVLIEGDILEVSVRKLFSSYKLKTDNYKLVANIPYYITGAIIRKFLEEENQPEKMVLLVQKEVAERACAKGGKESLLSISIKVFGNPKLVSVVKAGSFVPKPKVDSAILSISDISRKLFKNKKEEEQFFKLIHIGFAHKRKTLAKNLKDEGIKSEVIARIFSEMEISEKIRAEDLHINRWFEILRAGILDK